MSHMGPIEIEKSNLILQYIDMEKRIILMHSLSEGQTFCKECFQEYPCDTITKGINNE